MTMVELERRNEDASIVRSGLEKFAQIALDRDHFETENERLWAENNQLKDEADRLATELARMRAERDYYFAQTSKYAANFKMVAKFAADIAVCTQELSKEAIKAPFDQERQ